MVRYPYQLWALVSPQEASQDANGNWQTDAPQWVQVGTCRDEANSKGGILHLDDGTAYTYESLLHLPKGTPAVGAGTPIQVRAGETVRLQGAVKRFASDQLHCRLWV